MEGGSLRAVARAGRIERFTSGICERLGVKFPGPTRHFRPIRPVLPAGSCPLRPENGPEAGRRRCVEVGRTPVIQTPKLGSFEFHAPKGGPKILRRSPKRNVRKQMQTEGVMTCKAKSIIYARRFVKSLLPKAS
jgi:hypothetical protein